MRICTYIDTTLVKALALLLTCQLYTGQPQVSYTYTTEKTQFIATANLLDASVNSINSLNSLLKKENYRNKIISFNNPTSSDMGFSLETEIQLALKPILDKARNTNASKFSSIITSLINNPIKTQLVNTSFGTTGIFSSLLGMVGNLTINEKRITRQDLDSFIITMNKYFVQYEKLNTSNRNFDQHVSKLSTKLQELQFDTKEYMLDMIGILHKDTLRSSLKNNSMEELLLKYLDKVAIENNITAISATVKYPADGIKTAKEIVYGIQKLFNEYQEILAENYNEINAILLQNKELGKNINSRQVDISVQELQQLYNDSKDADILNIRINTLTERLRILVNTEQMIDLKKKTS